MPIFENLASSERGNYKKYSLTEKIKKVFKTITIVKNKIMITLLTALEYKFYYYKKFVTLHISKRTIALGKYLKIFEAWKSIVW
jgi:hypothetical protein